MLMLKVSLCDKKLFSKRLLFKPNIAQGRFNNVIFVIYQIALTLNFSIWLGSQFFSNHPIHEDNYGSH